MSLLSPVPCPALCCPLQPQGLGCSMSPTASKKSSGLFVVLRDIPGEEAKAYDHLFLYSALSLV